MRNSADLVNVIKTIAVEAIQNTVPLDIKFGNVISSNPLRIQINIKLVLEQNNLILSRNVTDYSHMISLEGGPMQEVTFYKSLQIGDRVSLLRLSGGNQFLVMDRVV